MEAPLSLACSLSAKSFVVCIPQLSQDRLYDSLATSGRLTFFAFY